MRKFLAFDIETAKVVPEATDDILSCRPLGISCAAAVAEDMDEPLVWYGIGTPERPSVQMDRVDVVKLVQDLCSYMEKGYTIVTWNGAGFDFDVLSEESGLYSECVQLAEAHVDMLFHALCVLGHRISLQKASEGMSLRGKMADVSAIDAPIMWASGDWRKVLDYCIQDVRATLDLARECENQRELRWVTAKGALRKMPLDTGWLSVGKALRLPAVDASWMSDPPDRHNIIKWMARGVKYG